MGLREAVLDGWPRPKAAPAGEMRNETGMLLTIREICILAPSADSGTEKQISGVRCEAHAGRAIPASKILVLGLMRGKFPIMAVAAKAASKGSSLELELPSHLQ